MQFSVQVEKVSATKRKLTVQVPATEVAARIQGGFREVARRAEIKGFRRGMAPLSMVQRLFGADVRHQVFHDLIEDSYRAALRQEKIRPIDSPEIDTSAHSTGAGAHDHDVKENQDLTFTATVEILPELEPAGYKGVALTKASDEVDAKAVDEALEQERSARAELIVRAEDALAQKGDFVDIRFEGGLVTESGIGIEKKPGMDGTQLLELGSGRMIPGFEDALIGIKKGETRTFRVQFPADYGAADFAGKNAEFTVTANELKEKRLPALDDEFAVAEGHTNLAEMRKEIETHLKKQRSRQSDQKLRSDLLAALIEKMPFECPEVLIVRQAQVLMENASADMERNGYPKQLIEALLKTEGAGLRKRAETQVRSGLILSAIAKKEGFEVTEQDLEKEYERIASEAGLPVATVREHYTATQDRRNNLVFAALEERTIAFLLENAKIKKA